RDTTLTTEWRARASRISLRSRVDPPLQGRVKKDTRLFTGTLSRVPLVLPTLRCYIDPARLRRASGANISPGPYRSFRELSLAGSVDPDKWCPPTFVGNSGIERFNGVCGFALLIVWVSSASVP